MLKLLLNHPASQKRNGINILTENDLNNSEDIDTTFEIPLGPYPSIIFSSPFFQNKLAR